MPLQARSGPDVHGFPTLAPSQQSQMYESDVLLHRIYMLALLASRAVTWIDGTADEFMNVHEACGNLNPGQHHQAQHPTLVAASLEIPPVQKLHLQVPSYLPPIPSFNFA